MPLSAPVMRALRPSSLPAALYGLPSAVMSSRGAGSSLNCFPGVMDCAWNGGFQPFLYCSGTLAGMAMEAYAVVNLEMVSRNSEKRNLASSPWSLRIYIARGA